MSVSNLLELAVPALTAAFILFLGSILLMAHAVLAVPAAARRRNPGHIRALGFRRSLDGVERADRATITQYNRRASRALACWLSGASLGVAWYAAYLIVR